MEKRDFIKDIEMKLNNVNNNLKEIKDKFEKTDNMEIEKEAAEAIIKLEKMRDRIKEQYDDAREKKSNNKSTVELEKNIFNSIKSFDSAFTKAGSIFRTK